MHNVNLTSAYRKRVDAEAEMMKARIALNEATQEAIEALVGMGAFHAFNVKWNIVSRLIHNEEL